MIIVSLTRIWAVNMGKYWPLKNQSEMRISLVLDRLRHNQLINADFVGRFKFRPQIKNLWTVSIFWRHFQSLKLKCNDFKKWRQTF